jgi:hypothetical protein
MEKIPFEAHDEPARQVLLRLIRARGAELVSPPRIIGVDDWAWRRGHRYGTIICDLERRRVIDLLAERSASDIVVFGGGIIPDEDIAELNRMGVARIFTPGAPTTDIVDWVHATLGQPDPQR